MPLSDPEEGERLVAEFEARLRGFVDSCGRVFARSSKALTAVNHGRLFIECATPTLELALLRESGYSYLFPAATCLVGPTSGRKGIGKILGGVLV
jgi:hypothetical protein